MNLEAGELGKNTARILNLRWEKNQGGWVCFLLSHTDTDVIFVGEVCVPLCCETTCLHELSGNPRPTDGVQQPRGTGHGGRPTAQPRAAGASARFLLFSLQYK